MSPKDDVRAACVAAVAGIAPIALGSFDDETAEDRFDTKFLLPARFVPAVLAKAGSRYRVLDVNGVRLNDYVSTYFDTPERAFYHAHHAGRLPRSKVRVRTYVATCHQVLELKVRLHEGRTRKYRAALNGNADAPLAALARAPFATVDHSLASLPLEEVLRVHYSRVTLVASPAERVTFDIDLSFTARGIVAPYDGLAIAEAKGDRGAARWLRTCLQEFGIRAGGMSKYCLGVVRLEKPAKQGRFRPALARVSRTMSPSDLSPDAQ